MEALDAPVLASNTLTQDSNTELLLDNSLICSQSVIDGSHRTNGDGESLNYLVTSEINANDAQMISEKVEEVVMHPNVYDTVEEVTIDTNNVNDDNISLDLIEAPCDEGNECILKQNKTNQSAEETSIITDFVEENSENNLNLSSETVEFETEVLVEKEETTVAIEYTLESNNDVTNNILSELDGQNVNLSEELASVGTENTDNNNTSIKQEVFNNEELLDILEGNDLENTKSAVLDSKELSTEAKIALQQLKKLKTEKKKYRKSYRKNTSIDESTQSKTGTSTNDLPACEPKNKKYSKKLKVAKSPSDKGNAKPSVEQVGSKQTSEQGELTIVTALVKDWEDDDTEDDKSNKLFEARNIDIQCTDETIHPDISTNTCQTSDDKTSPNIETEDEMLKTSKSSENGTSQRRLSRVIKKKVIFDPDNPDTFTKVKSTGKGKAADAVTPVKEQPLDGKSKKIKTDQTPTTEQTKSPVSKMQWKKPSSKNYKRLSEVDKLLMDEGAVNMIYQLTPEASKGKKNTRTKAELIKKINQSSTPEIVEKKFRDRKKDTMKTTDTEAKKIPSGKQRSSVKSMSVGEDLETHSANDSIIYRRHSSSSYSSSCMSPRRLSDVEAAAAAAAAAGPAAPPAPAGAAAAFPLESAGENGIGEDSAFMDNSNDISTETVMKKEDCLSLKEKLKSRLSTVLNKRKRDVSKTEIPKRQKKLVAVPEPVAYTLTYDYKTLTISFDCRMAEICFRKEGLINNTISIEMLKELESALDLVSGRADATVTLLAAEFQLFSTGLALAPLLDDNLDKAANYAFELTSAIRTLLVSMERHSKVLVCGVEGECEGLGVALAAMCDVAVAAEPAGFRLAAPAPGAAVLAAHRRLPQSLVNELVVFGARVAAGEARRRGLVSRVLWPPRFAAQTRALARDIAAQPPQSVLLKKQVLNLRARGDREALPAALAAEQDLLVDYWTSPEGRRQLAATLLPASD